jgi:hypothetical protein
MYCVVAKQEATNRSDYPKSDGFNATIGAIDANGTGRLSASFPLRDTLPQCTEAGTHNDPRPIFLACND